MQCQNLVNLILVAKIFISFKILTQQENITRFVDLQINLKTELAWKDDESKAIKITEKQIELMIKYLKIIIDTLKKEIVEKIIYEEK